MQSPHPADDDLERPALDRLLENAAAAAEEHLLICAECRARLAGWDEYAGAMRAAMRQAGTLPRQPAMKRARLL